MKNDELPHAARDASMAGPRRSSVEEAGEDTLWPLLIEFALSQRGWWTEVCGTLDLTPTQGLVMRLLDPRRPMAMNALADAMVCDASNVTGVVDKLEARGLIARQSTENDRRVKMLAVTDKGRELRGKLFAEAARPPAAIAALPRDICQKLCGVLRALLSNRGTSAPAGSKSGGSASARRAAAAG
jgi:DNA-binding MarR family transcriptional regulator